MRAHLCRLSLALLIILSSSISQSLPLEISSATAIGGFTNQVEPYQSEAYVYSWTQQKNIPVRDVSDRISQISKSAPFDPEEDRAFRRSKLQLVNSNPNLTNEQRERAIKEINGDSPDLNITGKNRPRKTAPTPGGFGAGDSPFTSAFQYAFSDRTVLEYTILCPTQAGGNNFDYLYLTSTNRATLGVEAFVSYFGQGGFNFRVYDWARPEPDRWQTFLPYYTLSAYLTTTTVGGINYQSLTVYNSTKINGVVDPDYRWKNAVFLLNHNTGYYDLIYNYTYTASIAAQKTGTRNWGPIVETSPLQTQYTNINPMGFSQASISSYDDYGDHRLFPAQVSFDSNQYYGFHLLYLEANHTFTVH